MPASGTGIPGFVAGMAALHEDHGEMESSELQQPAITLAAEGFPVSDFLALRHAQRPRPRRHQRPDTVQQPGWARPPRSPPPTGTCPGQELPAGALS
ncbi:gamma-glutamyltransferase [Georgenia sp. AZ-5]|uniref:gamma-glutamyltransferase n=1 Tax=Georgenia sp. AZ-5 TaxID=3367526 RepID=UPI003754E64D